MLITPITLSLVAASLSLTLLIRAIQEAVSVDIVNTELTKEHGWSFSAVGPSGNEYAACGRERSGLDADYLYQLYQHANPEFTGTVTVPVLWVSQLVM